MFVRNEQISLLVASQPQKIKKIRLLVLKVVRRLKATWGRGVVFCGENKKLFYHAKHDKQSAGLRSRGRSVKVRVVIGRREMM